MAYIHTCQSCGRQYTVYKEGSYICDCGALYQYPAISAPKAKYAATAPVCIDASSRSFKRSERHGRNAYHLHRIRVEECPLAKASLVCAILSIPFFGLLALPALIFGFGARVMIASPKYHYVGNGTATAGIVVATLSVAAWAVYFLAVF